MIKLLFIFILFGISHDLHAQLSAEEHIQFIVNNSSLSKDSIAKHEQIYFVRFDYCGANKYCGKSHFVDLIDDGPMQSTLFIVDTAIVKNEMPVKMNNKKIIYVNRERMQRSGLFSGHTVLLKPKKKKVKWLD